MMLAPLALLLLGFFLPLAIGLVFLAIFFVFTGWLAYLSWPRTDATSEADPAVADVRARDRPGRDPDRARLARPASERCGGRRAGARGSRCNGPAAALQVRVSHSIRAPGIAVCRPLP